MGHHKGANLFNQHLRSHLRYCRINQLSYRILEITKDSRVLRSLKSLLIQGYSKHPKKLFHNPKKDVRLVDLTTV